MCHNCSIHTRHKPTRINCHNCNILQLTPTHWANPSQLHYPLQLTPTHWANPSQLHYPLHLTPTHWANPSQLSSPSDTHPLDQPITATLSSPSDTHPLGQPITAISIWHPPTGPTHHSYTILSIWHPPTGPTHHSYPLHLTHTHWANPSHYPLHLTPTHWANPSQLSSPSDTHTLGQPITATISSPSDTHPLDQPITAILSIWHPPTGPTHHSYPLHLTHTHWTNPSQLSSSSDIQPQHLPIPTVQSPTLPARSQQTLPRCIQADLWNTRCCKKSTHKLTDSPMLCTGPSVQFDIQGCHWTFVKITENLCVRAVSQKTEHRSGKEKKKEEDKLGSRGCHLVSDSGPCGTSMRKPEASQSNGMRTAHCLGMRPIYEFFFFFFFFTDFFSCRRPYFFLGNLLTKLWNSRKRGRILRSEKMNTKTESSERERWNRRK